MLDDLSVLILVDNETDTLSSIADGVPQTPEAAHHLARVPASRTQVLVGNTQAEIVRAARERHVDLIVLGGRERHGLSLLVDFTEDSVLHKAPCDVLVVRVKPAA